MSGILGLALTSVVALVPANAADVYGPSAGGYKDTNIPVTPWAGFYIGADVGGAWVEDLVSPTVPDRGTFPRKNTLSFDSLFGGGTVGYNFQRGNIVFGIEAEMGYMDIANNKSDPLGNTAVDHISSGPYADVTGRLGYAFDRFLVYGKGGVAVVGSQASTAIVGYAPNSSNTFTGWTAGGGAEYKITPSWSLKAEYLHFDFGSENATLSGGGGIFSYKNDLTVDTAKIGVNYQPLRIYEPLK
jgi:outer membrane immunogenic protein